MASVHAPESHAPVVIRGGLVNGFIHPGIGFTREVLENARAQVESKREPWISGFLKLAAHPNSAEKVSCRNQSTKDPSKPDSDTFDSRGMEARLKGDADKALRQALMYWFTAKACHRANAMNIIRTWSKLDPKKFRSFPEDHIHASYPVQNLITAAELMRYSSSPSPELAWSAEDTASFIRCFVNPSVDTFFSRNGHFMNQAGYPMAAAMAGCIFTNDRAAYEKRVEWFTMNKDAPNKGWSFSIQHLARKVDVNAVTGEKVSPPNIQLVEMGRDQAHAGGDIDIFMNISRMMNTQGTKVDPITGMVSVKPDAVGPYEFLDDRILATADHFCRFMLGYETPWIPTPSDIAPDGAVRRIYTRIADNYRGRIRGLDFWDAYLHYAFKKGMDVSVVAPYYHEAFCKRIVNSDSDWIFIPANASGSAAEVPATEQEPDHVEIEQRSTFPDGNAAVLREGNLGFVRVTPGVKGARMAILSCDSDRKTIGMRIRTSGVAEVRMSGFKRPWLLPDTRGEWRQVHYTMGRLERFIDLVRFDVKGSEVDIDTLIRKPNKDRSVPSFIHGDHELSIITYVGSSLVFDFQAAGKGVFVSSVDKPDGAQLNAESGVFRWGPAQAGNYRFVVMATDHDAIDSRPVHIMVMPDRLSAIAKIVEAHAPELEYVGKGLNRCKLLYEDALQSVPMTDDTEFQKKLDGLQSAFVQLEPLTPRLPDGSMDFPSLIVSSDMGEQIVHLADGNDDTFPVHSLAKDFDYILDFGDAFTISVSAFAIEGRLNFEERAMDVAFFGSNDGKNWKTLTGELTKLPTELMRMEVVDQRRNEKFRFLKVRKMNRNSAGLFEPSELRIYGQRHENR